MENCTEQIKLNSCDFFCFFNLGDLAVLLLLLSAFQMCLFIGLIRYSTCVVKTYLLEKHLFFHWRKKDVRPKSHTTLYFVLICYLFSCFRRKALSNLDFCSFSFQPLCFGMSSSEITLASGTASLPLNVLLFCVIRNLLTILNWTLCIFLATVTYTYMLIFLIYFFQSPNHCHAPFNSLQTLSMPF